MPDLKLQWDNDLGCCDLVFDEDTEDLVTDEGLQTAVLISLYTDNRALITDEVFNPLTPDRRGWWGNKVLPAVEGDEAGSKLWLLERAKTIGTYTENQAKSYIEKCLQWMIDDGIAQRIEVTVEKQGTTETKTLAMLIQIHKTDGTDTRMKFDNIWEAQLNAV